MASERFTDATAFRTALRVRVPKTMRAEASVVMFDATTELHEAIVVETPVDTGYLRAGLLASTEGVEPTRPRDRYPTDRAGAFAAAAVVAAASVGTALAVACGSFAPVTIGFVASYAPFVEDKVHMMKRASRQWSAFVRGAVARRKAAA